VSAGPDDANVNQSGEPDDLAAIDHGLLLALTGGRRDGAPLSTVEEQLLDDWLDGRLSAADAERAVALIKQNGLAAEHLLERRLVAAANRGPEVPAALSAQILRAAQATERKPQPAFRFRWPILSRLQWSAAGAAVAATIVAGLFGVLTSREPGPSAQRVQLAMVTLDDRRVLSGPSQFRSLRSDGTTPTDLGFRDVDIPADVLRRTIASVDGLDSGKLADQLMVYLPAPSKPAEPIRIAIDAAISERLAGEWAGRMIVPIRVYDLDDSRMRAARESLQAAAGTVLLTVRR
jgi:hypothetical protein